VNNIENLSDEELQAEIDNLYLNKFDMTQTELKKAVKGQH
jgi:tripartite-type tricarboxylate transporter receptor subunit TctC